MVTLTYCVGLFALGFSERWMYLLLCQPLFYGELSDKPGIMRPRVSLGPGCRWWLLLVVLPFSEFCTGCWCPWAWAARYQQLDFPSLSLCCRPWSCLFPFTLVTGPCAAPLASGCWPLVSPGEFSLSDKVPGVQALPSSHQLLHGQGDLTCRQLLMALRRVSPASPSVSGVVSNS